MCRQCRVTVSFPQSFHRCPLHYAALGGHVDITKILVENEVSLSLQDKVSVVIIEWLYNVIVIPYLLQEFIMNTLSNNQ